LQKNVSTNAWKISFECFARALSVYGFKQELLDAKVTLVAQLTQKVKVTQRQVISDDRLDKLEQELDLSNTMVMDDAVVEKFPALNFGLCVELYVLSLVNRYVIWVRL
jgi:hypothetical protein